MGVIGSIFGLFFGGGRNVVKETVETFRPNAEAQAQRDATYNHAALVQFASEFAHERKGWFDRTIDGLNRLPRPLMALGVIGLLISAMSSPIWFAERMQGIALVPDPLWWLLGVIVSFYFGARHSAKSMDAQKSIAATMARAPVVVDNIAALRGLEHDSPSAASTGTDSQTELHATSEAENAALVEWKRQGDER